jgi:electron transfer flavoprotein alpha subunit
MAGGTRRVVLGGADPAGDVADATDVAGSASLPLRTCAHPERYLMAVVRSERGLLDGHAQQTLAASALIADPNTAVVAIVLGELREDLAALGADHIVAVPECATGRPEPECELACVRAMIERWHPVHILLPDAEDGSGDLGRRLAAAHGMSIATAVVELDATGLACYRAGGTQLARRSLTDIVLLAPDVADARLPFVGRGKRSDLDASVTSDADEHRAAPRAAIRDLGIATLRGSELTLQEADFIIAAGNGVGDIEMLWKLADSLGAALGASRVVVDDGRLPRERQIGATGQTVSAGLYVAFGISGAVQHLQGIKDCRHVVAVNRDPGAPMIKRADLSVIADADATVRALLSMVTERGARAGACT